MIQIAKYINLVKRTQIPTLRTKKWQWREELLADSYYPNSPTSKQTSVILAQDWRHKTASVGTNSISRRTVGRNAEKRR